MLWTGFGLPDPWPGGGTAVAESAPPDPSAAPGGVDADAALYLRSSVDAAALALGGALASDGVADGGRAAMLAASLDDLTFRLGGAVYFTAWRGTRVFYSPLSPDAGDMDFAEALDARGVPFVRRMDEAAREGGGFVRVLLPRAPVGPCVRGPVARGPVMRDPVMEGADLAVAQVVPETVETDRKAVFLPEEDPVPDDRFFTGAGFCLPGDGQCPVSQSSPHRRDDHADSVPEPVEQVVYVRPVPGGEEHIAAFMPLVAPEDLSGDRLMEKGMRLSGLSLAGLAGLLLAAGGVRRQD